MSSYRKSMIGARREDPVTFGSAHRGYRLPKVWHGKLVP